MKLSELSRDDIKRIEGLNESFKRFKCEVVEWGAWREKGAYDEAGDFISKRVAQLLVVEHKPIIRYDCRWKCPLTAAHFGQWLANNPTVEAVNGKVRYPDNPKYWVELA